MGIELLLFSEQGGCQRIRKKGYIGDPAKSIGKAEPDFENEIRWAVSGYPLVLEGQPVTLEETAQSVSDFRHLWRLPKLQRSLVRHLARLSGIENAADKIEFYFGFDEIREANYFVPATLGEVMTFPTSIPIKEDWLDTTAALCLIDEHKLRGMQQYDKEHHLIRLCPNELATDFSLAGYTIQPSRKRVDKPGDFHIDKKGEYITVRLLPAIYPHHVVGICPRGNVINISIGGLSGRSGITIDSAKRLCMEIGLRDALIFDNGNDLVARIGGGVVICHKKNKRQTRLTAALHFGYPFDPGASGGSLEGFEMATTTVAVTPRIRRKNVR